MKLEYLAEGSKDCPLIRLYAFDKSAILQLRDLFDALGAGMGTVTPLHRQLWVEPVNGCELELCLAKRDQGVIQVGPLQFEWILSGEGWTDVGSLLDPFCASEGPSGFQWLCDRGKISLLLSPNGKW